VQRLHAARLREPRRRRAVLDVIASTRVANAEAKSKGTVMLLSNLVLGIVVFLSLFWPSWLSTVGGHIWRLTPSFGKFCASVAKTKILSGEHNGKSAAIRESIVLPR